MTTSTWAKRLLTHLDPDADDYWREVLAGNIVVRRCLTCDTRFVLPLPSCPECAGKPELLRSLGAGSLYTWVIVYYAFEDELATQVPYVVGAIELDEGARIFARVEGLDPADLSAGLRMRATYPRDDKRPPIVFVPGEGDGS
jgi:uncharacterized OB-fold protein